VLPVHLRFPGDSGWLDRYAGPAAPSETVSARLEEEDLPEATLLPEEDEIAVVLGTLEEEEDEDRGETARADVATLEPPDELAPTPSREPTPAPPAAGRPSPAAADATPAPATPGAWEMADQAMQDVLPPPAPRIDAPSAADDAAGQSDLRQLVRALVHDVRNPLVSIRTFSELLPDHYDDADFRSHFSELVGRDVVRIDDAISRLQEMVDVSEVKTEPVDVAQLLERLLDELRDDIQARRLLVLKELDHNLPHAIGDPLLLRDAFSGLVKRAIAAVSDRGDIYIASRHHVSPSAGRPTLRVLIRYGTEPGATQDAAAGHLDAVMAQTIVRSLGGTYTEDTTDADECVIVIDLPAPA